MKDYVKFSMIKDGDSDEESNSKDSEILRLCLHPKKSIREYVDVVQTSELEASVFLLI
jgi:hypothetical protein